MQLCLIFHKKIIETNRKSQNLTVIHLVRFSETKKTVTGVERGRGYVHFVFLIIFFCARKFPM